MHKDTHNKQKECIKQQAIRKKHTRYDEKNEIRRKSKKYLGQYHRLFYISLYSRKILYTKFFEKILAYYT